MSLLDGSKIEKWNTKIRDSSRLNSFKKLSRYNSSYRNEEAKIKYENIMFTSALESVVNSSSRIPSLNVEISSFSEGKNKIDLIKTSYRSKLVLDWHLLNSSFIKEINKCIIDSKNGYWGLMEIVVDSDSKLGYSLKRRSPFDLVTDPNGICHDLSDSRWIALQWIKHKDILAADSSLKNNKDLSGNYNPKLNDPDYIKHKLTEPIGTSRKNNYEDLVLGWDIYDRDKKEKLIIVDGRRVELLTEKWDIDSPIFPIITLWYYFNPDRQLPIAPASNIIIIEDEVNDLKHFQLNHARKISRTVNITKKGVFSSTTKRLLEESSRDIVAEAKKGNPIDAVIQLKEKTVSFEYTAAINSAKSGLSSLGQGFVDSRNFETAAEPNVISDNAQKVSSYESGIVEVFVSTILRSFLKLVQIDIKTFTIPLDNNTYINTIKDNISILDTESLSKEDAKLFAVGSISLEDIGIKSPDGKFVVDERGNIMIATPFLSVSKSNIKGDFKVIVDRGSMKLETLGLALGLYDKFKDDIFIDKTGLRRIALRAFENSEVADLLRSEHDIREEVNRQQQKAVQVSMAEPTMKKEADLKKTQMKTDSNERISKEKSTVKLLSIVGKGKGKE